MIDWSKVNLLIGIPTTGSVEVETMLSIIATIDALRSRGARVDWTYSKAPSHPMAANEIAWAFVNETRATHLLDLDNDLEFAPDVVVRMVERDVDCIGVSYRLKSTAVEQIRFAVSLNEAQFRQEPVNGTIKADKVGGGMMLLSRSCIERMHAAHPELGYTWLRTTPAGLGPSSSEERRAIGIYDEFVDSTGAKQTEDWAFCTRWTPPGARSCGRW